MNVRGSIRAVEEYARELERAEHELEVATKRVETLRAKAAGPPYPAGCCERWVWGCGPYSWDHWGWRQERTCGVFWHDERGWMGCAHDHHRDEPESIPIT